jgi:glycosyltransferase involved in cell wall biosynthesis
MHKTRVTHVITALEPGGAEIMLYRLLSGMDRDRFTAGVISLVAAGPIAERIRALGIPVWSPRMQRGVPDPLAILRIARYLQQQQTDVIQTWMYHANVIGSLAARMAGNIPVAWAIHHSSFAPGETRRSTIWTMRAGGHMSRRFAQRIVMVSQQARQLHEQLGYAPERMLVIPNGFDLSLFQPDPAARLAIRSELGLPADALLVGLIGRFHPQKDHHNFVQAAARLHRQLPNVHFLLCGQDISWENQELADWIDVAGLRQRVYLLGRRDDTPQIQAALDIATLSAAYGEAFPLVIGEAMACGVPCVVTDVGDAAMIVADTGLVVPPHNPQRLAQAWHTLLTLASTSRRELGARARRRVEDHFDLAAIVARYEQLYREIINA